MKKSLQSLLSFCCLFLVALACTKDVGLVTEVEFQLLEEHTSDGFVNQGLPTTFTIVPEEMLENYKYDISYEILEGNGYFENLDGSRWETGTGKGLDLSMPITTSLLYMGTEPGTHRLTVVATDNFGFKEELELGYNLDNVSARWEASSELAEIELGKSADISLLFEPVDAALGVAYEARLEFTSGSGTLARIQEEDYLLEGDYASIAPGTYPFTFTPSELGLQELVFVLRDSNGQELRETLSFNVAEVIRVISIFLGEDDTIELQLGDLVAPDITFDPPNATDQGIILVSDNPDVILIDENNFCIAVGLGTATVTVTSISNPDVTDTIVVTVGEADRTPVTSITITQENPEAQGAVRQLIATVLPAEATDMSVTWSSSDDTVATIDANGLLTGLEAGTVTITATSVSDSEVVDTIEVNISGGALQDGNDITAFELPGQNSSTIDAETHTITVNVTEGTELNTAPSALSISGEATIDPGIGAVRDFNAARTYTVTAGNGTAQVWTVNVTVSPPVGSAENDIVSFALPVQNNVDIDDVDHTVTVNVPDGTLLSDIAPLTLAISPEATVSPLVSEIQDFESPVQYTVTAGDGTVQVWTVNVTVAANQPPVATDDTAAVALGETVSIAVLANDTDPDTPSSQFEITGVIGVQPENAGSFTVEGQEMVFTSSGEYSGEATFGYTVNDGNDGNDDSAIVTVTISDGILITGITLTPAEFTLNVGQTSELGIQITPTNATNQNVTWSSNDETVATVSATGEITAISAGEAEITASSNDAGNVSQTALVTVISPDTTAPEIQLTGGTVTLTVGDTFVDPGYSASDDQDGDLTEQVVIGGDLDMSVADTYTVTYNVRDLAGNEAVERTRTVIVEPALDTTAPEIQLTGGTVTFTVGDTFVDPGYSASDDQDGDLTEQVVIGGDLDMSVADTYTVTYNVRDLAGNEAVERTRTVIVEPALDTTAPEIQLTGGTVTFTVGDTFVDPGYSASDDQDGDLTEQVVIGGDLDMSVADTYTVTYNVRDLAGNEAVERTRTVIVEQPNVLFSVEDGEFTLRSLSVSDVSRAWTGRVTIYNQATSFTLSVDSFLGTSTSFTIDGVQYSVSAPFPGGGDNLTETTAVFEPGVYDYEFRVTISNPGFSGGGSVGANTN
ncbi:DUF5011 domain-containing protein [Aggregatimonas sangjinii]|uniref:DUF5011 domain-containing protein n=1 Tax=Aggregatimonas sangjinii TaxID=2583587 RepID=A0A5B7SNX8_9FLAO|nr:immunoglobulin-like domain-containing protein [Aggregatimonas sangjinii]QCX00335.1 DUF5011 domain-containing protein [Aggregatimonas sangjinii]